MLSTLAECGVKGVHLEMSSSNTSAASFYRHMGFMEVADARDGISYMGAVTAL
jgi:hypothetical protein